MVMVLILVCICLLAAFPLVQIFDCLFLTGICIPVTESILTPHIPALEGPRNKKNSHYASKDLGWQNLGRPRSKLSHIKGKICTTLLCSFMLWIMLLLLRYSNANQKSAAISQGVNGYGENSQSDSKSDVTSTDSSCDWNSICRLLCIRGGLTIHFSVVQDCTHPPFVTVM